MNIIFYKRPSLTVVHTSYSLSVCAALTMRSCMLNIILKVYLSGGQVPTTL